MNRGKDNMRIYLNPGIIDFNDITDPSDTGTYCFLWVNDFDLKGERFLQGDTTHIPYRIHEDSSVDFFFERTLYELFDKTQPLSSQPQIVAIFNNIFKVRPKFDLEKLPTHYINLIDSRISQGDLQTLYDNNNRNIADYFSVLEDSYTTEDDTNFTARISGVLGRRIIAEIYSCGGFISQSLEFVPYTTANLSRVGKRLSDGTIKWSAWVADAVDYNKGQLGNSTTYNADVVSKYYMQRKYLMKSDVHEFFSSILRYQGTGAENPNNCTKPGFYNTSITLNGTTEWNTFKSRFTPLNIAASDNTASALYFLTMTLWNFKTENKDGDLNEIIQEAEILVSNAKFYKIHRIIYTNTNNQIIKSKPWKFQY